MNSAYNRRRQGSARGACGAPAVVVYDHSWSAPAARKRGRIDCAAGRKRTPSTTRRRWRGGARWAKSRAACLQCGHELLPLRCWEGNVWPGAIVASPAPLIGGKVPANVRMPGEHLPVWRGGGDGGRTWWDEHWAGVCTLSFPLVLPLLLAFTFGTGRSLPRRPRVAWRLGLAFCLCPWLAEAATPKLT